MAEQVIHKGVVFASEYYKICMVLQILWGNANINEVIKERQDLIPCYFCWFKQNTWGIHNKCLYCVSCYFVPEFAPPSFKLWLSLQAWKSAYHVNRTCSNGATSTVNFMTKICISCEQNMLKWCHKYCKFHDINVNISLAKIKWHLITKTSDNIWYVKLRAKFVMLHDAND